MIITDAIIDYELMVTFQADDQIYADFVSAQACLRGRAGVRDYVYHTHNTV